jgi:hypothetical protein
MSAQQVCNSSPDKDSVVLYQINNIETDFENMGYIFLQRALHYIVCLVTLKIGKKNPKKSTGCQIFFLIIFILRTYYYIL